MTLAEAREQTAAVLNAAEQCDCGQCLLAIRLAISVEREIADTMMVSTSLDAAALAKYNEQLKTVINDLLTHIEEKHDGVMVLQFVRGKDADAVGVELGMEIVSMLEDHLNAAKQ